MACLKPLAKTSRGWGDLRAPQVLEVVTGAVNFVVGVSVATVEHSGPLLLLLLATQAPRGQRTPCQALPLAVAGLPLLPGSQPEARSGVGKGRSQHEHLGPAAPPFPPMTAVERLQSGIGLRKNLSVVQRTLGKALGANPGYQPDKTDVSAAPRELRAPPGHRALPAVWEGARKGGLRTSVPDGRQSPSLGPGCPVMTGSTFRPVQGQASSASMPVWKEASLAYSYLMIC